MVMNPLAQNGSKGLDDFFLESDSRPFRDQTGINFEPLGEIGGF